MIHQFNYLIKLKSELLFRKMNLSPVLFGVILICYVLLPFFFSGPRVDLLNLYVGFSILFYTKLSYAERGFLVQLFGKRFCYQYKILESLLVILPLLLAQIFHQTWIYAGLLLVTVFIIHLIQPKSKTNWLYRFSFFHQKQFEWNSGFRKFFLPIVGLTFFYFYSLFFLPNDVLPFFIAYVIMLLPAFFQNPQEEASFIQLFNLNPRKFLFAKIRYSSFRLLVIGLPLVAFTWWIKPEINFWIPICVFVQSFVFLWISILNKYAFLNESSRFEFLNGILFCSSVLPFMLPLNLAYIFAIYRRAIKNLNPIL